MTGLGEVVASDIDVMARDIYENPYPVLRALREQGGAVYIRPLNYWLLTRYDDVRGVAADWETWTSAQGVALEPESNLSSRGTVLAADPPQHTALRAVLSEQLSPRGLAKLRGDIRRQADALVAAAAELKEFDAVTELTRKLPVQVVADLIGIPEEGRENLLRGADANFALFGPRTEHFEDCAPVSQAYLEWIVSMTDRERLRPGSWGSAVFDAVDDGRIAPESAPKLMIAYLIAGMDTTVNGIGSMLHFLAREPELWQQLRADPSLAGAAFEESLRLESPVQGFFRVATRDLIIDGAAIPKGGRALLHFGAANRDERHYPDPDRFDIRRNPLDHLAFGYGIHGCAGQGLARIEALAIVGALLDQVKSISLAGEPELHFNPVVRGLETLPIRVEPKSA